MAMVSIIVPVYNRSALLARCLGSIERQTLADWECLVVDDGSTDASVLAASAFAARDARFKVFSRSRPLKGAAACRNEGVERAKGKYLIFLDSDDLLTETCVATRVDYFSQYPSYDFIVFQTGAFNDSPGDTSIVWNIVKPESDLLRFMRLDAPWSITGPIWKRSALLKMGGFDESLPGWQDWQLHVVALLAGLTYVRTNASPDCFCQIHGEDKISRRAATLDHVKPKADYVLRLIKRTPLLKDDLKLRNACIGLVWYMVLQLQEKGRTRDAMGYWHHLWRYRFIGFRMYVEGLLALAFHGRRGGSLAWKLIARWPLTITQSIDRSTFLSVCSEATPAALTPFSAP